MLQQSLDRKLLSETVCSAVVAGVTAVSRQSCCLRPCVLLLLQVLQQSLDRKLLSETVCSAVVAGVTAVSRQRVVT